nr:unnamed protein product [Callosobruchus analis]
MTGIGASTPGKYHKSSQQVAILWLLFRRNLGMSEVDELVDSLRNITLESLRLNLEDMATHATGEVRPIILQMLKMFVDTIPSFNVYNKKEDEKGNPLFLPEIKFWESKTNYTANAALTMNTIDLRKIEEIQEKVNLLQAKEQAVHALVWSSGSSIVSLLLLILAALI